MGAEAVARARADGYTLLFAGSSNTTMATTVMNDLRYSLDDFSPVGMIARVSYGLAVHPRLPVNTMAELIHHALDRRRVEQPRLILQEAAQKNSSGS